MLLSVPHLGQEAADADAVDTLDRNLVTFHATMACTSRHFPGEYGERCIHATNAKLVHEAHNRYLLQEICLQAYALLPQLFCSNVVCILPTSPQLSVPPLDAPG